MLQSSALIVFTTLWFSTAWASPFATFQEYKSVRDQINGRSDIEVIQYYHQELNPKSYAILNKKTASLMIYTASGYLQSAVPIQALPGDEMDRGGSGIYTFKGMSQGYAYAATEKDQQLRALFKGENSLSEGTPLYVLPESNEHKFRIRNEGLIFNAAKVFRNKLEFNYSPLNERIRFSRFSVSLTDAFSKRYVRALQVHKPQLMQLLKIDNDEFNMFAEFAFGVLSPETDFGSSFKYQLKQSIPWVVAVFKGNGFDTSANSRGPTQIKRIPPIIVEHFKLEKSDLKIPENAAITTVAFAAEQIRELRNMAHLHPNINEETLQDYMYYLYQGRRFEVRDGTAVPEQNISIQKIKAAIELLTIEDAPY